MAASRRKAILSKVLTRLYPGHIEGITQIQQIRETQPELAQPSAPSSSGLELKSTDLGQNECARSVEAKLHVEKTTGPVHNETELMPHQKIYTVSPPPEDYLPGPQNGDGSSATENSDLHEDIEVKRRKRRRRRKKANGISNTSQQPNEHQPPQSECVFINKSRKRKLQRKRQKERLKAAGLWPKTKTETFTNQPEREMVDIDTVDQAIAQSEEELKKIEELLDFLQATQEIYFTDRKASCADSDLTIELVLEMMNQIKNGAVPFSELCLLHHLKSLLLLQDIERLKDLLDSFKEHSSMPLGHKLALHSLFCYWISDILPIKIKSTS